MIKLKDFRKKFKDSIDKNIESGLSMNTSGENLVRGSGDKVKYGKLNQEGEDQHIVIPIDPTKPRYRTTSQREKEKEIEKIKNNQASPIS